MGSQLSMGLAFIYRIGVSPGAVVESSLAVSSSVNRSVRVANDRAYAVTSAGQLYAVNATAFGVAVGAADGFVYFIDRHDASSAPAVFRWYYVGLGNVASLAYDVSSAQYMASSSGGRLSFISASSVADPTGARE